MLITNIGFFGNPTQDDLAVLASFEDLGQGLGRSEVNVVTNGTTGSCLALAKGARSEQSHVIGYTCGKEPELSAYFSHTRRVADLIPAPPMPIETELMHWLGLLLAQDALIFDGTAGIEAYLGFLAAVTLGAYGHPKRMAILVPGAAMTGLIDRSDMLANRVHQQTWEGVDFRIRTNPNEILDYLLGEPVTT